MATSTDNLVQPDELQLPDDTDTLYEIVDGHVVEKPPMGALQIWIAKLLSDHLSPYVNGRGLGRVVPEMLFDLAPITRQRRPDLAFVSYERWPKAKRVPDTNAWPVIPDLAVVSPSNTVNEIVEKLHDYFQAGVRLVWVVLPVEQQVYIYTSPTEITVLTREDQLDGGDVIPELRIPLAEIFEEGEDAEDQPAGKESQKGKEPT